MIKVVNQGYAKKLVYEELARIYFEENKDRPSKEDFDDFVQELAHDSLDSAIPNEILGLNPQSRMSKALRKKTVPEFFEVDSVIEKIHKGNKVKTQKAQKDIGRAVTHLTDALLENIYGFQITQSKGADLKDPEGLSDFQAMEKKGNKSYTDEEIDSYNKGVMVNNIIRHMIGIYFYAALIPWIRLTKKDLYQIFIKGGINDLQLKNLYKPVVIVQILYFPLKAFKKLFLSLNVEKLFENRWIEKEFRKRSQK